MVWVKIGSKGYILCVISMVVILDLMFAKLLIMIFSLYGSMPDVPSSRSSSRGCFISALAKIIRCFSPPDKLEPFSAIRASRPPFEMTKSLALVNLRH